MVGSKGTKTNLERSADFVCLVLCVQHFNECPLFELLQFFGKKLFSLVFIDSIKTESCFLLETLYNLEGDHKMTVLY